MAKKKARLDQSERTFEELQDFVTQRGVNHHGRSTRYAGRRGHNLAEARNDPLASTARPYTYPPCHVYTTLPRPSRRIFGCRRGEEGSSRLSLTKTAAGAVKMPDNSKMSPTSSNTGACGDEDNSDELLAQAASSFTGEGTVVVQSTLGDPSEQTSQTSDSR